MKSRWSDAKIKAYVKKRDKAVIDALTKNDYSGMIMLAKKNGQTVPSKKVMKIAAHKMCVNITTMPNDLVSKSLVWLASHGYDCDIYNMKEETE